MVKFKEFTKVGIVMDFLTTCRLKDQMWKWIKSEEGKTGLLAHDTYYRQQKKDSNNVRKIQHIVLGRKVFN